MKNLTFVLFAALLLIGCDTTNPLYSDLMTDSTSGVFRGVHFNMSKAAVLDIEESRDAVSIYEDETPEELIITTDMGEEILDFADVTYSFDDEGLYGINVESYNTSPEKAQEVFDLIIADYTTKFGDPEIAEDGFYEFNGKDSESGLPFMVAIKTIEDVEDSYGLYMFFDII